MLFLLASDYHLDPSPNDLDAGSYVVVAAVVVLAAMWLVIKYQNRR